MYVAPPSVCLPNNLYSSGNNTNQPKIRVVIKTASKAGKIRLTRLM